MSIALTEMLWEINEVNGYKLTNRTRKDEAGISGYHPQQGERYGNNTVQEWLNEGMPRRRNEWRVEASIGEMEILNL